MTADDPGIGRDLEIGHLKARTAADPGMAGTGHEDAAHGERERRGAPGPGGRAGPAGTPAAPLAGCVRGWERWFRRK
jgi:hypothetical protein